MMLTMQIVIAAVGIDYCVGDDGNDDDDDYDNHNNDDNVSDNGDVDGDSVASAAARDKHGRLANMAAAHGVRD